MTSEDRGPQILSICGPLVGLAVLSTLSRLWVRIVLIRQVGWDDHIMGAAAVSEPMPFYMKYPLTIN